MDYDQMLYFTNPLNMDLGNSYIEPESEDPMYGMADKMYTVENCLIQLKKEIDKGFEALQDLNRAIEMNNEDGITMMNERKLYEAQVDKIKSIFTYIKNQI